MNIYHEDRFVLHDPESSKIGLKTDPSDHLIENPNESTPVLLGSVFHLHDASNGFE